VGKACVDAAHGFHDPAGLVQPLLGAYEICFAEARTCSGAGHACSFRFILWLDVSKHWSVYLPFYIYFNVAKTRM
jgi:hypothetical protein